jgi:hypothetical protein
MGHPDVVSIRRQFHGFTVSVLGALCPFCSSVRLIGRLEQARAGMQSWRHTATVRTLDDRFPDGPRPGRGPRPRLHVCDHPHMTETEQSAAVPSCVLCGEPSIEAILRFPP